MEDAKWEILDRKASFRTIWLCLAMSVVFKTSKETTIEGLMTTLDKLY